MKKAGEREPMYTYRQNIVYEETKVADEAGYVTVHRKAPSQMLLSQTGLTLPLSMTKLEMTDQ